jgi:polar amino acid transport system permease protein
VPFDLPYLIGVIPELLAATGVTLLTTVLAMLVAMVLGLPIAMILMSSVKAASSTLRFIVEAIRLTPLLVQLYFAFYVLPLYGITLPALLTGVAVIGLHYACYTCEVYRAGFLSVPVQQREAILVLGIPRGRALRRIILPQAVRPMVPAFGNYLIALLKETPLLSAITIPELVATGKKISFFTFKYFEIFTAIGIIFLVLSYGGALVVRHIEARMRTA